MSVTRSALKPAVLAAFFVTLVIVCPATLSAKPKHVTTLKPPRGSTVQMMNNGHFRVRNGLGVGGTYSCTCSSSGSCSTAQSEGVLTCGQDGDSCKGTCQMSTTTGGGGKVMMR